MQVEQFSYKFGTMKKADTIVVYPGKDSEGYVTFQGGRLIGKVNPETRQGILNYKGSHPKYFHHLTKFLGAEPWEFTSEFVTLVLGFKPSKGDTLAPNVYLA